MDGVCFMRFERAMPNERYDLFMTNRAELVDSFRTHTQSYILFTYRGPGENNACRHQAPVFFVPNRTFAPKRLLVCIEIRVFPPNPRDAVRHTQEFFALVYFHVSSLIIGP